MLCFVLSCDVTYLHCRFSDTTAFLLVQVNVSHALQLGEYLSVLATNEEKPKLNSAHILPTMDANKEHKQYQELTVDDYAETDRV